MLNERLTTAQRAGVALLLLLCGGAYAAEKKDAPTLYHVEMIVFAHTDNTAARAEQWPETFGIDPVRDMINVRWPPPAGETPKAAPDLARPPLGAAAPAKTPEAPAPGTVRNGYQFVAPNEFKLTASAAKLRRNPRYDVLLHAAWRQPPIDLKEDAAVYVFDRMTDLERPLPDAQAAPEQSVTAGVVSLPPSNGLAESVDSEPMAPRFSGTLKVASGRYLHVALDLLYRHPTLRAGGVNAEGHAVEATRTALQGYRLNETRRIKLGEVHYFDHPAFGALVLVAPIEKGKGVNVEKETVGTDAPAQRDGPDD
jgi:hypothetical protein